MIRIGEIEFGYLSPSMQKLSDDLISTFKERIRSEDTRKTIMIGCIVVFMLIAFFAMWMQFINGLVKEVCDLIRSGGPNQC